MHPTGYPEKLNSSIVTAPKLAYDKKSLKKVPMTRNRWWSNGPDAICGPSRCRGGFLQPSYRGLVVGVPKLRGRPFDAIEVVPQRQNQFGAHQLAGVRRDHAQHEDAVFAQEFVDEFLHRRVVGDGFARVLGQHPQVFFYKRHALIRREHYQQPINRVEYRHYAHRYEPGKKKVYEYKYTWYITIYYW